MSFKNVLKILLITIFLFVGSNAFAGTFGWQGGTPYNPSNFTDEINGSRFLLTQNAEIQSVSVYLNFDINASTSVAIYDNAEDLVATTTIVENTSGDIAPAWFVFTFVENPILEPAFYRLVVWTNAESVDLYLEQNSTFSIDSFEDENFPDFPLVFEADFGGTENLAIYATYTRTTPYITIPVEFATNTLAYAGQLFTDLSIPIILTIGLPLGFWIIKKIIGLV